MDFTCPGWLPSDTKETYLLYARDVSYVGMDRILQEIDKMDAEAKEYAYRGLAVYYTNDNWLKDLISEYRLGIIERKIPAEYRLFFYEEIARKIFNYYRGESPQIKRIINKFDAHQRELIAKTGLSQDNGRTAFFVISESSSL